MYRIVGILPCSFLLITTNLFTTHAHADQGTFYGKANVTLQTDKSGDDFSKFKSNASRLGILGDIDINDSLSVIYQYAIQVDAALQSDEKNIKDRNQYIGLAGEFGSIIYGRRDTSLKKSQGKIDQFNDYLSDIKHLWKGENRIRDSLTYKTNSYNEFSLSLTYIDDQPNQAGSGYSAALSYGDVKLKRTKFYTKFATDRDVKGYDINRAITHFKVDKMQIGLGVQRQEKNSSGEQSTGYLAVMKYPIGDTHLRVQYQTLEDDNTLTIGADYPLSKDFKLTFWYASLDHQSSSSKAKNQDYLAVGLEYKFKHIFY